MTRWLRLLDPGPPRGSALLRCAVLGVAAAVLWWPLTLPGAALVAGATGLLAALGAEAAARRGAAGPRLRTASVALLAGALALVAVGAARLVVRLSFFAELLGPAATLRTSELLLCVGITGPVLFALRLAAARHTSLAVVELSAVGAAFLAGLAAHRQGMVHRPHIFGDFAWSRGLDPTLVFLCLGGLCLLILAALLLAEERPRRIPLHLSALLLIGAFLAVFVRLSGLPQPRPPTDLGLTGESKEQKARGGEAKPSAQFDDLPFRNEYPDDGVTAPVAVVLLHDDYTPPSGAYYFRQSAFSRYNGRRLVQAIAGDVDRDVVHHFPTGRYELPWQPPAAGRHPLRITVGLLLDHVRPFALDSPIAIEARANRDRLRFQRTYEAESLVSTAPLESLFGRNPGDPEWDDETWRHYTEAPADPRYAELAREAAAVLRPEYKDDPLARAFAVKFYLDTHGTYSRRSSHADGDDPTASFLFGDLTGYCVHFSHAAVYLLRALGVPARVASGYAVPEGVRGGGSAVMIRAVNAHAWPEIFLEGVGWVVVDLSPERYLDRPVPHPDPNLQAMLGEMLREGQRDTPLPDDPARQPLTWAAVARAAAALLAAALGLAFAVKGYRALAPRLAPASELPRVGYRAVLDRLSDLGWARRYGESRERFAERAAALSASFPTLTALHLRATLGGRGPDDPRAVRRLAAEVAGELQERVPAWRRALGWLHPFAWLRSR